MLTTHIKHTEHKLIFNKDIYLYDKLDIGQTTLFNPPYSNYLRVVMMKGS